jgi:hypothetical protein
MEVARDPLSLGDFGHFFDILLRPAHERSLPEVVTDEEVPEAHDEDDERDPRADNDSVGMGDEPHDRPQRARQDDEEHNRLTRSH